MPRLRPSPRTRHLTILLPLLISCGAAAPSLGSLPAGKSPAEYDDALATWTRKAKIYRNLESRITAAATYLSPRFLEAMTAERRRIFTPTEAELSAWSAERADEAARSEVFFLALFTGDRVWNDLDQDDSMWRLYLETDRGDKVAPERIVAIRGRPTVLAHFFPELGHFCIGYWVYFPRYAAYRDGEGLPAPVIQPSLSWFRLQLRSPVASADLTWKLD